MLVDLKQNYLGPNTDLLALAWFGQCGHRAANPPGCLLIGYIGGGGILLPEPRGMEKVCLPKDHDALLL